MIKPKSHAYMKPPTRLNHSYWHNVYVTRPRLADSNAPVTSAFTKSHATFFTWSKTTPQINYLKCFLALDFNGKSALKPILYQLVNTGALFFYSMTSSV